MTLELTEQQWRLVETQAGRPVEIIDPDGRCSHMLIARDQFEKVRRMLDEPSEAPTAWSELSLEVSPGILRSQESFWRDLPELLKQKKLHGRWVCYYGDERIGIAKDNAELYERCQKRGLKQSEFYVGYIEERALPPWEPEELEISLYEAVDIDESIPPAAL